MLAAAPLAPVVAQTSSPTAEDKVRGAARDARKRLDFADGRFSGAAYNWLVGQGRDAAFFLLGEEHGIAENPKLAAQLFRDLVPAGYGHVAVEISPPMAREVDRVLVRGGVPALTDYFGDQGSNVAFFGMREEAEWLSAARAAVPGARQVIWGNDYEVGADRRLIHLLKPMRKPAAAEAALSQLEKASTESWAQYEATRNPRFMYSFGGDPELVRAVRAAWPGIGPEADWILSTLEETFEVNRLWVSRQGWASNARRAANMRRNFLRHWQPCAASPKPPKVLLKYGSNHMIRGLNETSTFDLGSLVPELAEARGARSFHLLVLPGNESRAAVFDPTRFRYAPNAPKDSYQKGLEWMIGEARPDAFTLFDTHALRPLVYSNSSKVDPELLRVVFGYDAVLVMSGSTPSSNLL
ncbi:hypothetical protein SCH01S_35_00680 [Sphingomonas changbaiensis NBRC 104936]|uniref:Uncharacterized protein n=1 Tax=Sphingomonas changbaiensis NBRC 104936 TaxID=1219043 RepID=A0A0E9MQ58_9SPHN|nr:hypothetical protein SCH01S_35_00680 [Sphingomonas changbaiensis NBRC 104936]